jgi:hypothetical protein
MYIAFSARDILAIPGTSVSVERLFSSARHLSHESRASLKPRTNSEAMLTKIWIKDRRRWIAAEASSDIYEAFPVFYALKNTNY